MKVAVLGAAGTIAPAIVRDLASSDEVSDLLLLDLDGERAAAVAAEHGEGRARAASADARSGLAEAIAGADVLVNSASYRVNLDAMNACLLAGCHYMDLGGLYRITGHQLAMHDDFERDGLLALLGIGSSPGKTNLMAALCARELGSAEGAPPVDAIHVSAAGRDLDPPLGLTIPYALQTLIDELTIPPVVIYDGKVIEIEPMSPGGSVDFAYPIGRAETIHTLHSELRTFPESFGCTECSFRLSLPEKLLERLRKLAEAPPDEIAEQARRASRPSPKTVACHVVEAYGDGGTSVRAIAVTKPMEQWGIGGGVVSTAAPAAAAVRLLARGRIDARGALPPERCIDPGEMFTELESRGVDIEVETGHEQRSVAGVSREGVKA
jgi:saccharopine dehydrogenase (NAD+, L-lysine-forming)